MQAPLCFQQSYHSCIENLDIPHTGGIALTSGHAKKYLVLFKHILLPKYLQQWGWVKIFGLPLL